MATYKVVRADIRSERAAIIENLVRNEPDTPRITDQLAWHWERNPHGEGRAWFLVTEPAGKIVGVSGIVLRRMFVNGEPRLAGRTWGVSVDKEHRTLGPALLLAKAALGELERDLAFLYVLPYTRAAGTLFARVGYKRLTFLDRHVRVLRSKDYLRNLSSHKVAHPAFQHPLVQRSLSGPLVELLAAPIDLATRLRYDQPWQRPHDLMASRVCGFDGRFDDLWERAKTRYALTSERSSEFLGWRFRRSWDDHLTVGFSRPGDTQRLAGYAVLTWNRGQAIVHDFFLEDPAALAGPALWLLVDWVREQGFESIAFGVAGAPELRGELARRWFVNRTDHDRPMGGTKRPPAAARAAGAARPAAPAAPGSKPVEELPDELFFLTAPAQQLPDPSTWHFCIADDV